MFAETGIGNIRNLVEAAHFLSIEQASELLASRDALAAELAEARKVRRWITIRRVGGEHDPMARVVVDYEVDGASITLGSELLASNFSHGWNLTALEARHAPLSMPADRTAMIERACEAEDGSISAGSQP